VSLTPRTKLWQAHILWLSGLPWGWGHMCVCVCVCVCVCAQCLWRRCCSYEKLWSSHRWTACGAWPESLPATSSCLPPCSCAPYTMSLWIMGLGAAPPTSMINVGAVNACTASNRGEQFTPSFSCCVKQCRSISFGKNKCHLCKGK
jgi:hypothetical protein